jgi:hypothetical protein
MSRVHVEIGSMEAFISILFVLLVVATWGVYRIAVVTKETSR